MKIWIDLAIFDKSLLKNLGNLQVIRSSYLKYTLAHFTYFKFFFSANSSNEIAYVLNRIVSRLTRWKTDPTLWWCAVVYIVFSEDFYAMNCTSFMKYIFWELTVWGHIFLQIPLLKTHLKYDCRAMIKIVCFQIIQNVLVYEELMYSTH